MYTVTKAISFCYGHRILHHQGKCRHLHGHNAKALVTVQAETLDALGMVVDFSVLGKRLGAWIDAELDHTLLLADNDPLLPLLQGAGERVQVLACPPTAEHLARLIFEQAQQMGFEVVSVVLEEAEGAQAAYDGKNANTPTNASCIQKRFD